MGSGRVLWRKTIGPSESSPVVSGGSLFVGDWSGRVYSFSARTGRLRWMFQAGGKVKDGIAVSGGHVYFGAYDSHVYALDARTGKLLWRASSQPRLGQSGEFYATPAASAYGRVFIGSTDGKEYAFGATTGDLLWSHSTGGYVYSSSAVWRERIYAGSYSHSFFCFDAATGDTLWSFRANGAISGSPTVVAGRVYFSTLAGRTYRAQRGHRQPPLDVPGRQVLAGRRRREAALPRRLHAHLRAGRADREACKGAEEAVTSGRRIVLVLLVALAVTVAAPVAVGGIGPTPLLQLGASPPRRTVTLPILLYHRIDVLRPSLPAITRRLTVSPQAFAAQMEWLQGHGFHAVSQLRAFDALEHGAPLHAQAGR